MLKSAQHSYNILCVIWSCKVSTSIRQACPEMVRILRVSIYGNGTSVQGPASASHRRYSIFNKEQSWMQAVCSQRYMIVVMPLAERLPKAACAVLLCQQSSAAWLLFCGCLPSTRLRRRASFWLLKGHETSLQCNAIEVLYLSCRVDHHLACARQPLRY